MMLATKVDGGVSWNTTSSSTSSRHVEHKSVSTCSFVQTTGMNLSELFGSSTSSSCVTNKEETMEEAIVMEPGCYLRLVPMERHYGGWSRDVHFNPLLQCPAGGGIVLTLETMARECIAIALSPSPEFVLGKTYEVHIGANGNLSTVLRRVQKGDTNNIVQETFPSIRICSENEYTKYWIIFQKGKLSVGIRTTTTTSKDSTTTTSAVGNHCLGTLDDTLYDTLRPGQDAIRYIGLGNSSVIGRRGDNNPNIVKIRNLLLVPIPPSLRQSGGIGIQKIEHILIQKLMPTNNNNNINQNEHDELVLLKDYEEECKKAQARAMKFNVAYKDPPPDAFLKWSEARRLRANPQSGFATGFDLTTKEEEDKRLARKERFASSSSCSLFKRKLQTTPSKEDDETNTNDDNEIQQLETPTDDPDITTTTTQQQQQLHLLPVTQAWDNHELVQEFRKDPVVGNNDNDTNETVPEKIHLFAMDWAAFKQIRSEDIMVRTKYRNIQVCFLEKDVCVIVIVHTLIGFLCFVLVFVFS